MKMKSWIIVIFTALALSFSIFYASSSHEPPTISGYFQTEKSVTIAVTLNNKTARFVLLPDVPESLNIEHLKRQSQRLDTSEGEISIPIENEPIKGEYSIIIFLGDDYVELVRQSQHWLKETFNFDHLGGYTILGRRSLTTKDSSVAATSPLVFSKIPQRINYDPVDISPYVEINYAAGLLQNLWSKPMQQGPTSKSYTHFLEQTFEEKIRRVETGDFAVMCQGFRDLFIHAASADKRFNARPIDAFNYSPQLPGLISYSHATAEIYIKSLDKWVLFDPWLAIIVTKNSVPVGSAEISQSISSEGLALVPLIDQLPRMYKNSNGQLVHNFFYPKDVSLDKFKCQNLGCYPGYLEYFRTYLIRDFQIN
jgi:hypothetical protein